MKIPKIIHQAHTRGLDGLTDVDRRAIELLKKNNPDWQYCFYDFDQMLIFIQQNYEKRYLDAFLKINKKYGAAQADYFRYLLMYKLGGAYFDVKSFSNDSLNHLILPQDELLVFEWQGGTPIYEFYGLHKKIRRVREYQQWNIICAPSNQYLENVIEKVTLNIETYTVLNFGYGMHGVLHTTGPIPYTNAIDEVEDQSGVRLVGSSCKHGLIFKDLELHFRDKTHYSLQTEQVVLTRKNLLSNFFILRLYRVLNYIRARF